MRSGQMRSFQAPAVIIAVPLALLVVDRKGRGFLAACACAAVAVAWALVAAVPFAVRRPHADLTDGLVGFARMRPVGVRLGVDGDRADAEGLQHATEASFATAHVERRASAHRHGHVHDRHRDLRRPQ